MNDVGIMPTSTVLSVSAEAIFCLQRMLRMESQRCEFKSSLQDIPGKSTHLRVPQATL